MSVLAEVRRRRGINAGNTIDQTLLARVAALANQGGLGTTVPLPQPQAIGDAIQQAARTGQSQSLQSEGPDPSAPRAAAAAPQITQSTPQVAGQAGPSAYGYGQNVPGTAPLGNPVPDFVSVQEQAVAELMPFMNELFNQRGQFDAETVLARAGIPGQLRSGLTDARSATPSGPSVNRAIEQANVIRGSQRNSLVYGQDNSLLQAAANYLATINAEQGPNAAFIQQQAQLVFDRLNQVVGQ